jgi:hypothetical protein
LISHEEDEPTDAEMVQESVSSTASILEQEMKFQVVDSTSDSVATEEDEPTDAEMVQESVSITASIPEQKMEFQVVDSASDSVAIDEDEPIDAEMVQESVCATSNGIDELNYGDDMASSIQDLDMPSQSEPETEHTVDDMDVPSLQQQDVQTDESEGHQKEAHVNKYQEAHHGQKLGSDMWSRYLDNFSKLAVAGSVLAVLVVSAALAFLYMRQNQTRVSSDLNEPTEYQTAEQVEQVKNGSGSGSSDHALAKSSHLQNPVVEETERIGGSGASQYSSSLSSELSKRRKDKEKQSLHNLEPMSRRESTGTSSYGSFTTYEKIPAKKVS